MINEVLWGTVSGAQALYINIYMCACEKYKQTVIIIRCVGLNNCQKWLIHNILEAHQCRLILNSMQLFFVIYIAD